jgi:hypothetical protein
MRQLMGSVPRPLLGLLVAAVAFFALWTVALKPHGSGSSSSGLKGYQSDINAAKNVQHVVDSAASKAGGTASTTSSPPTSTLSATSPAPTHKSAVSASSSTAPAAHNAKTAAKRTTAKPAPAKPAVPSASSRLNTAAEAFDAHKVVALLFYNPAAADDQSVKRELAAISTHKGRVVKLAVPLNELPNYAVVTSQVPVNFSPTLVIVDAAKQAQEITGYAGRFEISHRIDDALAAGTTP